MPNTRQTYSYVDEWKRLWEPDLEAIAYNGITCDPTRVDPKVVDWIHENCVPEKPHFVKVINRNAAHDQPGLIAKSSPCLTVPAPFAQEHFTKLQRVVTLENGDGRKWKVAFCAAQRHPLWLQGWKRFARDNELRPGDVVVFELSEDSHFHFTKFDEDGNICPCNNAMRELRYSPRQLSATETDENPKLVASSGSDPEVEEETNQADPSSSKAKAIEQVPETPCKRRRLRKLADKVQTTNTPLENETPANPSTANEDCGGSGVDSNQNLDSFNPLTFTIFSKRRTVTTVELQRALDLAEAHARTITTSPHFLLVMTHAHVYQHFHLVLPDSFVQEAKLPTSKTRMMLEDCTGKTWEVQGRENVKFHVQFYRKPWALFALHHLLEEGDVCVFQLTCDKTRTILVRIFRVVPIPMLDSLSHRDHYERQVKTLTRPSNS